MTAPKRVQLTWVGPGLSYEGSAQGGPSIVIDGENERGPSPMDTLLLGAASCMAIDIQGILEKSRVAVEALDLDVEGIRAEDHPRRYTHVTFVIRVSGPGPDDDDRVARAIQLSRDKYCSVVHSLRQDIEIETRIERI